MADLDVIASALRQITYKTDRQWILDFLCALQLPDSTLCKLKQEMDQSNRKSFNVLNRATVIICDYQHFEAEKLTKADRIGLLIHLCEANLVTFNRFDGSINSFECVNIVNNIDSLLPLIYGNRVYRNAESTQNLASIIAQLSNNLSLLNVGVAKEIQTGFLLNVVTLAIGYSFADRKEFGIFLTKLRNTTPELQRKILRMLLEVSAGRAGNVTVSFLPKQIVILEPGADAHDIQLDDESIALCLKVLQCKAEQLDAELLAASIYKLVKVNDDIGIYGYQTTHDNALLLLDPLCLDEIRHSAIHDELSKMRKLLDHVYNARFFDPTDGPGCFLSSALRSMLECELLIQERLNLPRDSAIRIENYIGLVSNKTTYQLSKLTIWLTYLQHIIHYSSISRTQISETLQVISIHVGDQLESPWEEFCPMDENTMILGSPTFRGARKQTEHERRRLANVFSRESVGDSDLSAGWLVKGSSYIKRGAARVALVLTNSVCQGAQVSLIWPIVFANSVRIYFARPSLKWRGSSARASVVTVVIVGLGNTQSKTQPKLYLENNYVPVRSIGPYLVANTEVIVHERTTTFSDQLPTMRKGNMPYDGGLLLLDNPTKEKLLAKVPKLKTYLRKIVGSEEFINRSLRWCLWISAEQLDEAMKIPEIKERVEAVKLYRQTKSDKSAKKLAVTPYRFRETYSTKRQTLVIPSVSSENRKYVPIGFIGSETIVSNLAFAIYECEPWVFSLLTSRIHNLWIRTVCGALETRIRYSNRLGYNTFPFPRLSVEQKSTLNRFAFEIINERENFPEISLGDLYSRLPETLRLKHEYLDLYVDSLFESNGFVSDNSRLERLFKAYEEACR